MAQELMKKKRLRWTIKGADGVQGGRNKMHEEENKM